MGATVLEGVNETPFHVTDSIVAHPRRFTRAKPDVERDGDGASHSHSPRQS